MQLYARHMSASGLQSHDIEKQFPAAKKGHDAKNSGREQIVCFADKFFSKDNEPLKEKPISKAREFIARFGRR